MDVNQSCIDACKKRLGDQKEGCQFYYYVNDGNSLKDIEDECITFVYSFDSMVHFDKLVVRDYLQEFYRIMRPWAFGFVYHSNLDSLKKHSGWADNHGSRSDVSASLFRDYCSALGIEIIHQKLLGLKEGVGMEGLDYISVFKKPGERQER